MKKNTRLRDGLIVLILFVIGAAVFVAKNRFDNKTFYIIDEVNAANFLKADVTRFFMREDRWPNSNEEVGYVPEGVKHDAAHSITVSDGGVIRIIYTDKVQDGAELIFTPYWNEETKEWQWTCGTNTEDPSKTLKEGFMKKGCRQFFSGYLAPQE